MQIKSENKTLKYISNHSLHIALLVFGLSLFNQIKAQKNYPQNYFRSPLDIPLVLSGSFAELRSNHFHSGVDFKTQGVVGHKVYAVADGYVSRIKVSPWGYGKAIYIKHPNGYTSVYSHLKAYKDTIAEVVKAAQYKKQSFSVEIFPEAGSIPVKKGEIIALSGNSGSSGGPHLHFEIRDSRNEEPINPLYFGYQIADHQHPSMRKLRLYYLYENGTSQFSEYPLSQKGKKVNLRNAKDTLAIFSEHFYPAIEGFDRWDAAVNKNGYYSLSFYLDDSLFFQFKADRLNFSQQRYINSYIDYNAFKKDKIRFQRSLVEENNQLKNLQKVVNRGILNISDSITHKISIVAADFAGQESKLEFHVIKKLKPEPKQSSTTLFEWKHKNTYRNADIVFEIPERAMYSNQYFWVKKYKNTYSEYSALHEIYDIGVPLHKYCQLKIKVDSMLDPSLYSKACIISLSTKEQAIYEGGKFVNGYLETKTRSFGKYYIDVDTLAPIIEQQNVYNNKNITRQQYLSFKVKDDLSGIKKYQASIDGKWVLLQYDPKKSHFYYEIDKHFPAGKHQFLIEVWDNRKNYAKKEYWLVRD